MGDVVSMSGYLEKKLKNQMSRNHDEFNSLIRYFVDIQEPKFDLVYVKIDEDCKYTIYDDKKNDITKSFLQDFINELEDEEIEWGNLIISTLITIAPRKIVIQLANKSVGKDLVNFVQEIFGHQNISFCSEM
jgi:putative sporulation protein YtxC